MSGAYFRDVVDRRDVDGGGRLWPWRVLESVDAADIDLCFGE